MTVLSDLLTCLDAAAREAPDLRVAAGLLVDLRETRRELAQLERDVEQRIADLMGDRRETVMGVGVLERHRVKKRLAWDREELLRVVRDSRLVNRETGEIAEETELQRVLAVWNLGAPRVTALRERGIDGDEFCSSQDQGRWTVQVTGS